MARNKYQHQKRLKELARKKKKEEKRLRKLAKNNLAPTESEDQDRRQEGYPFQQLDWW